MRVLRHGTGVATLMASRAAPALTQEEERSAWRLFVWDHGDGVVSVVDPVAGETLARLAIDGRASLHRSESGETVRAVQGVAGRVAAIATGIAFDDRGDHADIEVGDARLLDVAIEGDRPSHFVEHHGDIDIFFDGEGRTAVTTEAAILEGRAEATKFTAAAPHHGAAAAFAGHVPITAPDSADPDELSIGVRVLTRSGEPVDELHGCPGLHGEASSGNLMAFACTSGFPVVRSENGAP